MTKTFCKDVTFIFVSGHAICHESCKSHELCQVLRGTNALLAVDNVSLAISGLEMSETACWWRDIDGEI